MVDFSAVARLHDFFAPTRFGAEVFDCEVTGTIPADLDGAFYRMHGDWFYPPPFADEASLSADGYISMFRIKDGIADYRGRYVRTDRFEQQRAARKQLYGYYRNPYTDDPKVRSIEEPGLRTSANTTPVVFNGKLYATKEDGLPHEIDPNTLETIGIETFGGNWHSQAFTAHPKVDPVTGEMIAYGYEASGLASKDVVLCTFNPDGTIKSEMRFDVPHTTMLHDIAITRNYVIIPGSAAVTSLERLQAGKVHWGWDQTADSYYAIVPRDGRAEDIRWFYGAGRSIVHTANAWEDCKKIVCDMPMADGNTWPFFPDIDGTPFEMYESTLRRVTFDLESNSDRIVEDVVSDLDITTFTRIDERFTTQPNRYIWVQYVDQAKPFRAGLPDDHRTKPTNTLARFDLTDRSMKSFFAGETHILQEPTFVPRKGSTAEGDGYILATVHNLGAMRSELVIVDAMTMGEIGRIILPFRNAYQVHGIWADAGQLPLT
ncbi:MAG: carotenoid oxygenase family protein [Caulobacteraceae bacterium]